MIIADLSNPFYALLASGIESECGNRGYMTMFADSHDDPKTQQDIIRRLIQHNVAGVFFSPASEPASDDFSLLEEAGIPTVQIMRHVRNETSSYVGPDNERGMELVVNHLYNLGHRKLAYIGGPLNKSSSREREKGFHEGVEQAGLAIPSEFVVSAEIDRKSALSACELLINLPEPPTAIVCYNDVIAIGAMLAMYKHGIIPGKEISVTGFDDIQESALWTPALTTISIDAKNIGRLAANALFAEIEDQDTSLQRIIVQPRLVVRDSTSSVCGKV